DDGFLEGTFFCTGCKVFAVQFHFVPLNPISSRHLSRISLLFISLGFNIPACNFFPWVLRCLPVYRSTAEQVLP
ncbi:MAG: hypothetical protein NC112_05825, partial [Oxalobacter formigenes]|nr:hypothetical protein [Oxalobacter formigenes]